MDGFTRHGDGGEQGFVDGRVGVRRGAVQRLDGGVTLRRGAGGRRGGDGRAFLFGPGLHEELLEDAHHRAGDLNVGVAPGKLAGYGGKGEAGGTVYVDLRDVDAAGEGDGAVDDQELAVVAAVDVHGEHGRRGKGAVGEDIHAVAAQVVEQAGRGIGAVVVVDKVYLQAHGVLGDEELGEFGGDGAVELVAFHVDAVFGGGDGGEHGGVGAGAVFQQMDVVAGDEGGMGELDALVAHDGEGLGLAGGGDVTGEVRVYLRQGGAAAGGQRQDDGEAGPVNQAGPGNQNAANRPLGADFRHLIATAMGMTVGD